MRYFRAVRGLSIVVLAGCVLAGCDDAATTPDDGALYLEVEALIRGSCAMLRCHGSVAGAGLNLLVDDLRGPLVGIASCEYPPMQRVTPGDATHSWLMVKVAGPARSDLYLPFIDFEPEPGWDPATRAGACDGSLPDGAIWFGTRMPADGPALSAAQIALLERWIDAGAPGPPPDHDASFGCLSILGCDGGT